MVSTKGDQKMKNSKMSIHSNLDIPHNTSSTFPRMHFGKTDTPFGTSPDWLKLVGFLAGGRTDYTQKTKTNLVVKYSSCFSTKIHMLIQLIRFSKNKTDVIILLSFEKVRKWFLTVWNWNNEGELRSNGKMETLCIIKFITLFSIWIDCSCWIDYSCRTALTNWLG